MGDTDHTWLGRLTIGGEVFQSLCLWKNPPGIDIIHGNIMFSLVKEEEEGGREWEPG